MSVKPLILVAGLFCLSLIGAVPASAQSGYPGGAYASPTGSRPPPYARGRPEITITPQRPLYRRCVERLQLQYRLSGPVLYPLTYCWWVWG